MIIESLPHSTDRLNEEAKCVQWAIEEEELEPGLALDPASYLAKAMQRKRKETSNRGRPTFFSQKTTHYSSSGGR